MAKKIMKHKREKKKKHPAKYSCLSLKSSLDSAKLSLTPAYNVYVEFCQKTTLHGLRHTVEHSVHYFERFLWFVLTVSAFGGAVYCALSQLSRYNSEPVVVSLQRDYRNFWTMFPAVTACFVDRLEPVKAKEIIEMNWNVTEETDPERYEYYYGFLELVTDVSFRTNLQNFWKYQNDDSLLDVDLMQLVLAVHPTMLLKVMISDVTKEVYWAPVMTEVGMCMTFNSHYAEFQFILQDANWHNDQLLRCHYHSSQCFVRIDAMNRAVRFFIHSPFEISTSISNPTGEVTSGEEMILDFKAVEIEAAPSVKHLRPEQRRCRYPDEWISNNIKAYSFGLCQLHCRNRMAMMFCGCRPYFYVKGDGPICDAQGMACIGRNVEILINLPKNLAKCSCMPQCNELNYYSHTKKVFIR
ncbi:sodium channel protein Nach-like [Plodia interpunctella]|uniref:sodium channel protein Nach-like n=1 Tax=Plodia interpunctella TaxID=58824 RepID=UPI0023685503|nr:sodium channel protein Nach-like [Plodia interpunctella]XP_053623491.1 sodium channel protein Nach-like [Plodia interpunctella]